MDIAMVDQSVVDTHLQRVNRFVDNVNKFQQKLDSFMSSSMSSSSDMTQTVQMVQQSTNAQTATFENPAPRQKVTADEIDIDAILNGIDLNAGMTL